MLKVIILFGRRCKATLYPFANPSSHHHKDNCIHVPRRLGIANARKGIYILVQNFCCMKNASKMAGI